MSDLEEQIRARRRLIFADAYPMSIGELTNLYRDGEIDVHPEFQRVFRWTDLQTTRLIESILLGIPLPSVFVSQGESGAWDVVDGVQRLSTILQFQGILKDDEGNLTESFTLEGTEYLPALAGKVWESDNPEVSLTSAQRIDFKRAKLDLQIIKRESSADSKYDLFQRLNSYGTQATPQELRNCLLVSINRGFYEWLRELSDHPSFVQSTALSERLIQEQYGVELALRFLIFRTATPIEIGTMGNVGDYVTRRAVEFATNEQYQRGSEDAAFRNTFDLLWQTGGDDVFRRWNEPRGKFQGSFLNTAFEVTALGLGYHIQEYDQSDDPQPLEKAKDFWRNPSYSAGFATGIRADARMAQSVPLGRSLFAK